MFKAIGRWGSNVKGNFNLKFITNLFGTKSKSYNEIESDEEEIFSDAREDPLDLDEEVEEDIILTTHCELPETSTATVNGSATEAGSEITVTVERSSHSEESSEEEDDGGDDERDGGQSHLTIDNEEGHNHKDSDLILETDSKPTNGIIRNASSSAFKKVHRRISSFTQKQYSKMDDATDGSEIIIEKDPNDNIAGKNGAANGKDVRDDGQSHLTIDNEEGHNHKDSDLILETDSKPTNGIIRNASSSAFKKVHRRISSFTQKQYSKMDDATDGSEIIIEKDPNDNIAGKNGAANGKDIGEQKLKSKDEKKRKRNKVPLFKFFRGLIRFPFRSNTSESGTK